MESGKKPAHTTDTQTVAKQQGPSVRYNVSRNSKCPYRLGAGAGAEGGLGGGTQEGSRGGGGGGEEEGRVGEEGGRHNQHPRKTWPWAHEHDGQRRRPRVSLAGAATSIVFVATNKCLSNICRDKHNFVGTKVL